MINRATMAGVLGCDNAMHYTLKSISRRDEHGTHGLVEQAY